MFQEKNYDSGKKYQPYFSVNNSSTSAGLLKVFQLSQVFQVCHRRYVFKYKMLRPKCSKKCARWNSFGWIKGLLLLMKNRGQMMMLTIDNMMNDNELSFQRNYVGENSACGSKGHGSCNSKGRMPFRFGMLQRREGVDKSAWSMRSDCWKGGKMKSGGRIVDTFRRYK